MNRTSTNATMSIIDLPAVLAHLCEKAQGLLHLGVEGPCKFSVRYLRRKPMRNLVVVYAVDEMHSAQKTRSTYPKRSISLILDEHVLNGTSICFTLAQVQEALLELEPSGVLRVPAIGLSLQAFPVDRNLLALATCCDTTGQSPVFEALQSAAQVQLCDPGWRLIKVIAEPVRYKPASRCVIAYHLQLEHARHKAEASWRTLTLFGKVYADCEQACKVQSLQQHLYEEQERIGGMPLLPRSLGGVDALGLTLTEAVEASKESSHDADGRWGILRTGTRALQPQLGRGSAITRVMLPNEELRLAAQVLARLHNSKVHPHKDGLRTGANEAKRVKERASLLADRNPVQAEEIQRLVQQLASRLEMLQPEAYRLAHGSFKPSQLLFHSQYAFVVDFDGFCLADPALDVGCFLAYLHPSGLWYQRPAMRQWFEAAAEVFRSTYCQVMLEYGVAIAIIDTILDRSRLYEAAFLFKIANRRVNRLNSPRPQELAAMLNEIGSNLTYETRRR
ncbi:MAG: hypothetical protein NVS4B11_23680 [Ktedonobacteraceae bacterium]